MVFAGKCASRPFATRLGLAGSIVISLSAFGAGATLRDGLNLFDVTTSGKVFATATLYLGIVLLLAAWVRLGHLVRAGFTTARDLTRTVWIWAVPLLIAPPLFSTDLYTYLAQGAVAQAGLDPYTHVPGELSGAIIDNAAGHWLSIPSPYGPLFILIVKSVLAVTGDDPLLAAFLTRLILAAGLGLLCRALPTLCRHLGGRPEVALWLAAGNPLVLMHLVSGGHNDLLMIGLLAAGTGLVLDRAPVRGFALVALAVAVKGTAGVALPFLVWVWMANRSDWRLRFLRVTAVAVSTVVVTFGLCSVVAGVNLGWIFALSGNSVLEPWLSMPTALGKITSWTTGMDTAHTIAAFRLAGWIVLAALVTWLWWRSRDGGPPAIRGAGAALLVTVLFSPVVLPWYFSWSLTLGAATRWRLSRVAVVAAASTWLVLSSHPDGKTQMPPWGFAVLLLLSIAVGLCTGNIRRMRDKLRSALAAIDNAEAIPVSKKLDTTTGNDHVVGAAIGVGSTEARRRDLTPADLRSIVENEVQERAAAAEDYETSRPPGAATRGSRRTATTPGTHALAAPRKGNLLAGALSWSLRIPNRVRGC